MGIDKRAGKEANFYLNLRARFQNFARQLSRHYVRLRSMPYRDGLRYLVAVARANRAPQQFSVLGFEIFIRPGTTDLEVACESLGPEFDPPISYFEKNFNGIIIDAGGYIGTSALKFAQAFPQANIYVLEPNDQNFAILIQNVANVSNIKPIKAALSAHDGMAVMLDRGTGPWGFTIVSDPADASKRTELNVTSTYSVSGFFEAMKIKDVGIFKIDIEGGEAALLSKHADWLSRTELLVIELHEWIVPGVEASFAEATCGRANLKLPGEKFLSIRKS